MHRLKLVQGWRAFLASAEILKPFLMLEAEVVKNQSLR
jgi:hypothetical protein